jgi:ribonuclease BN (tRNA processing enzyme)
MTMTEGVAHPLQDCTGVTVEAVQVNHPGPTLGFLITGPKRGVVYTGDTGPTQRIWEFVNERPNINDILLETSFPNRLQTIADDAQHLTPQTLQNELKKIKRRDVKVHIYHIKVPYLDEIRREIEALDDKRIRLLQPGDSFELS